MSQTDPFSQLPSPILLAIVKLLLDLLSLRSLNNASPTFHSLMDESGPEIIDEIMHTSLPEQILILIRGVKIIRSNSIAPGSLDEFTNKYLARERDCEFTTTYYVPKES